jgi:hypothetical protein
MILKDALISVLLSVIITSNVCIRPRSASSRLRPIDISFSSIAPQLSFQSNSLNFKCTSEQNVTIALYPILHIAEESYFHSLKREMQDCDVVLFELITSVDNTILQNNATYRRRLKSEVRSPKAEAIASQMGFTTQLDMSLTEENWFIADLSSEDVASLEGSRKSIVLEKYRRSQVLGRGTENILPDTIDSIFVALLRRIVWLTPSPEVSLLLIDWSRVNPQAGGVPRVLLPILENIITLNFLEAKKIAFAQQILSGISDSGDFGGEAKSDTDVRVLARNEACCQSIKGFVDENRNKNKTPSSLKIGILFGAYHISDLCKRINLLGFSENFDSPPRTMTMWSMTYPDIFRGPDQTNFSPSLKPFRQSLVVVGAFIAYLSICTLDWWSVINFLVEFGSIKQNISTTLADFGANLSDVDQDSVVLAVLFEFVYLLFYIQRHESLRKSVSQYAVDWDRSLFEDCV